MPRGVKKEHLPVKTCVVCDRPFNWRKKWEKCWDEVTTCSKSCNRKRREENRKIKRQERDLANDQIAQQAFATTSSEPKGEVVDGRMSSTVELSDQQQADSESETKTESLLEELYRLNLDANLDKNSGNAEDTIGLDESISSSDLSAADRKKAERKAAKKEKKAARRAQREGRGDPSAGQKPCDLCDKSVDLLIRCQTDETLDWKMVCGKCWNKVSGGVVDGDKDHPHYRYGGLWKNRRKR